MKEVNIDEGGREKERGGERELDANCVCESGRLRLWVVRVHECVLGV